VFTSLRVYKFTCLQVYVFTSLRVYKLFELTDKLFKRVNS